MNGILKINKINKEKNKVKYEYEFTGLWDRYMNVNEKMYIEYETSVVDVPDELLIIPFICNILPICWVFNLEIHVDTLDEDFYNCIDNIKKGYQNMYPQIKMKGNIVVKNIRRNKINGENAISLFSGGVDAFDTLINNIDRKPILLTIWGADVDINNNEAWERVKKFNDETATKFNLKNTYVKSNFRKIINDTNLYNDISKYNKSWSWWHEFQHGIGSLGHTAPLAYLYHVDTIFIASSFTKNDIYTCASDPTIDNKLKFAGCKIIHDGYEYCRIDKVHNICKFVNNNLNGNLMIRVCWKSKNGNNCCNCEKCYRTILEIISEKDDPQNYGFSLSIKQRKKMIRDTKFLIKYTDGWMLNYYKEIQNNILKNYSRKDTSKDLLWLRNIKIKDNKSKIIIFYGKVIRKIQNGLYKINRKLGK